MFILVYIEAKCVSFLNKHVQHVVSQMWICLHQHVLLWCWFLLFPWTGVIHEDHLRELLTTMGDRFTDEEVDELFREAPIDKKGNFNYAEFTRILKHGAKDKDDM